MSISLLENYKVKLVVFVFAIFIWFFVVTENEYEYDIDVPILPVNQPEEMLILNPIPEKARVKIKGNGKDLIALLLSGGAHLELDLSPVTSSKTFQLDARHVILARPIGSVATKEVISPDSLTIMLDKFAEKKVPVRTRITVSTAPGYTAVGDFQVTPDSVLISGPASLVSKVAEVYTVSEEFKDLRFDLNKVFPLAPLPFKKLDCAQREVQVYLNVQKLLEMTMNSIPVRIRNAPKNVQVTVIPSTLSLVLEGGGDLLTQLDRDDIVAYIDYNRVRLQPGTEFPAVIERPEGVNYRDVKPRTFKLVFER